MGIEIPEGMKTIIEAERLKSRLLGLEDGFSASDSEITELKERIATLEAQLTEAREQLDDWENREAACCPEDYGFEEVIATLRKQLANACASNRAQSRQEQPK